jgi:hypothetical protein
LPEWGGVFLVTQYPCDDCAAKDATSQWVDVKKC